MNGDPRLRDRTIALAAIVQAITLVHDIAESGQASQADMETLFNSLVVEDAPSAEAIYGHLGALRSGLRQLIQILGSKKGQREITLLRYLIALMHLERQLAKRPDMIALIDREIAQVPQQINYFGGINKPQVIARLADIYQQTLSDLKPQVIVYGNATFLQQPDNTNRIRALLLAGVRAAVLWRQKGGRRWLFLFQSGKLLAMAEALHADC